jgi:hypothetical protein
MKTTISLCIVLSLVAAIVRADESDAGTAAGTAALQPLEESKAEFPAPAKGDKHPEAINVTTVQGQEYTTAYGSGYVHASVAKVLEALKDAQVVIDRRRLDSWNFPPGGTTANSFVVHNIVRNPALVEFDVKWTQGVLSGTETAPKSVIARGEKISGSKYVTVLEDSIVAKAIDPRTTAIQFVRHLKAAGQADPAVFVKDVFASIVAKVHGNRLPTFK